MLSICFRILAKCTYEFIETCIHTCDIFLYSIDSFYYYNPTLTTNGSTLQIPSNLNFGDITSALSPLVLG